MNSTVYYNQVISNFNKGGVGGGFPSDSGHNPNTTKE